jgi:hypothetical protein
LDLESSGSGYPRRSTTQMDAVTSAKMMYSAVSMNEKQAALKERMASTFRRGKRDKDKSVDDDEEEGANDVEELAGFSPKEALWKGGSVLAAAATIGTNIFTMAVFGDPLTFITATVATGTSTTVAYREVTMDSIDSRLLGGYVMCP